MYKKFDNIAIDNDNYQESENKVLKLDDKLRSRLKKSLKRKATPVINREIHPLKAMKRNRGDKRKRVEEKKNAKKTQKTSHKLPIDTSLYQKWNF